MGYLSEMGGMIGGDKNTWRGMRKKNVMREIQTQVKRGNLLGPSNDRAVEWACTAG